MTTIPLTPGFTRTRPGNGGRTGTSTYSALLAQSRTTVSCDAAPAFYWSLFGASSPPSPWRGSRSRSYSSATRGSS